MSNLTRWTLLLGLVALLSSCGSNDKSDSDVQTDTASDATDDTSPADTGMDSVGDVPADTTGDMPPGDMPDDADTSSDATDFTIPPQPSPGCGLLNPPVGAQTMMVQMEVGDFIVSVPASYDENVGYPLGFGFHGHGRTHENCQNGDCRGFQSAMEDDVILVYMKSFSDGWTAQPTREQNVAFFMQVLDFMENNYCIDTNRVFVAGTSSGASFSNILACRVGDRLLATGPVAGGMPEREDCVGNPAAIVVHGVDDYHVMFSSGETARDFYIAQNGCMMTAVPVVSELHDRVVANRESYECADYQGCDPGKLVRWCEHSEGGYDGSTHGWPTFGGDEIWRFVQEVAP